MINGHKSISFGRSLELCYGECILVLFSNHNSILAIEIEKDDFALMQACS